MSINTAETNGETERTFWHLSLTVVSFLQDVGRRDVHDLLQNKRKGLLRSRGIDLIAGLEAPLSPRLCQTWFLLKSDQTGVMSLTVPVGAASFTGKKQQQTERRVSLLSTLVPLSTLLGGKNNNTQAPCSLSPPRALVGYS